MSRKHKKERKKTKQNLSQQFRLKNVEETRNYFVEEIGQNELMSNKHKRVFTTVNYSKNTFLL